MPLRKSNLALVRPATLHALTNKFGQLWLDVGCGNNKQPYSVGMDRRGVAGVDVVHDAEKLPWPFPDDTFTRVLLSHVMEHLNPSISVDIVNEIWRISKVDGLLMLAMPYPGSQGHWQDPTHIKPCNQTTPLYFDPACPELYCIYEPRPWHLDNCVWRDDGNIEIAMRKLKQ